MKKIQVSSKLADFYVPLTAVSFERDIRLLYSKHFMGMLSVGTDNRLYLYYAESEKTTRFQKIDITGNISGEVKHISALRIGNSETFVIGVIAGADIYFTVTDTPQNPQWIITDFSKLASKQNVVPQSISVSGFSEDIVLATSLQDLDTGKVEQFFVEFNSINKNLKYYPCATNFENIKTSQLGQSVSQMVPGVYTYGTYVSEEQILYTPIKNVYQPTIMPQPIRLKADKDTEEISLVSLPTDLESVGTHLFTGGGGKLFFYPFQEQVDYVKHPEHGPQLIAESEYFNQIRKIISYYDEDALYIWILNENRQLVYLYADKETSKWSEPLLFCEKVFYFEAGPGKVFLCEETESIGITIGEFNKISGIWDFSNIVIDTGISPGMEPIKIPAYMSKVVVCEENGQSCLQEKIKVKASKPISAYVNGIYHNFKEEALTFETNEYGMVDIVQPAESSFIAASFEVSILGENDIVTDCVEQNPSKQILEKLMGLNTVEKMKSAEITDIHGNKTTLLSDISEQEMEQTAKIIGKLGTVKKNFLYPKTVEFANLLTNETNANMVYIGEDIESVEILDEVYMQSSNFSNIFYVQKADGFITDVFKKIGDAFNYVKNKIIKGFDIVIDATTKAWNFVIKIGEQVIAFVIDTAEQIYSCVVKVLECIKAGFDKIFNWLKLVFNIQDIIKLKNVIKQFVKLSLLEVQGKLDYAQSIAKKELEHIIKNIEEWGDIQTPQIESGQNREEYQTNSGNMYLFDIIFRNLCPNIELPAFKITSEIQNAVSKFMDVHKKLEKRITAYSNQMMNTLMEALKNVDVSDLSTIANALKKASAVLAVTGLRLIEQIVDVLFILLKSVCSSLYESLDATIYLPFISEVLGVFGIKEFSLLDILTIVPAFFSSIVYKVIRGKALVDEEMYHHVMNAKTISELRFANDVDQLGDLPTGGAKTGVLICKFSLFATGLMETIIMGAGYYIYKDELPTLFIALSLGMGLIDFACSCISGYIFYSPMSDATGMLKISCGIYTTMWIVKTAVYSTASVLELLKAKEDNEENKQKFSIIANITSIVGTSCSLIGAIAEAIACVSAGLVVADTPAEKKDKGIFIAESIGYIADDIRNIVEACYSLYEKQKTTAFLIMRTFASGVYSLSHMTTVTILEYFQNVISV